MIKDTIFDNICTTIIKGFKMIFFYTAEDSVAKQTIDTC